MSEKFPLSESGRGSIIRQAVAEHEMSRQDKFVAEFKHAAADPELYLQDTVLDSGTGVPWVGVVTAIALLMHGDISQERFDEVMAVQKEKYLRVAKGDSQRMSEEEMEKEYDDILLMYRKEAEDLLEKTKFIL